MVCRWLGSMGVSRASTSAKTHSEQAAKRPCGRRAQRLRCCTSRNAPLGTAPHPLPRKTRYRGSPEGEQMELKSFRIRIFRSISDSGEIDVSRTTALLGRNESGESNILRALHSLNPATGFTKLKPIKDFPRHRKLVSYL